jgi:hypothetical protein
MTQVSPRGLAGTCEEGASGQNHHADMEEAESLQQDSKDKVLRMRTVSQVGVMRAVEPPDLGLFQIARF